MPHLHASHSSPFCQCSSLSLAHSCQLRLFAASPHCCLYLSSTCLTESTDEEDALQLDLYYKFLHAQTLGFDGAFEEFVSSEIAQPVIDSMPPDDDEPEEVLFLLIT